MQNESSGVNTDLWRVGEMHDDGRLQIGVIKRVLEPSGKCSGRTRAIMYERLEPRGFTWKEVSKETKQFYFEEFKKWFVWRQPDNVIYATWLKNVALRFTDLRSNARKDWENGKMNNRIGQDVWLSWIENWKTPEFQAKSKIKKSNRKGGVEGDVPYPGTHTSDSVSHRLLATRLGDPPATALFTYAHTRDHDNVTFVDKKSEKLHEKIVNLRAERSQPTDGSLVPQSVDENKLYYDAVGGRNKIYGLGSTQNIYYEPSCNDISQSTSFQPNVQDYQKLEAELHEMKERMRQMDEMQQQMRSQLAMMSNNHNS
ncbi:hypothetical protein POM88_003314 [Heracleum sosnowskyi]|uniref:Transposase n=1 Tax=Heracleum sosnowskyi TaxID=360622 RepID=A0AAD8JHT2_9APIA|nr:hypothetical protein POM88_003314 [Heracleum sosnowskyi]